MNKTFFISILTILFSFVSQNGYAQVDWPSFLAKQDLVWERLPEAWHEAPFMGNGSMGTYICKEPGTNAIRLDVGNNLVHDHRANDPAINGRCRLLIGYFLLHPVGEIKDGEMRLDLWNAETTARIQTSKGEIRMRAYVASGNPYLVAEVETTEGEAGVRWQFYPECTDSPRQIRARKTNNAHLEKDYVPNPPSEVSEHDGIGTCWQPLLDGGGTGTAWKIWKDGQKTILVVSNAHTFPDTTALAQAKTAVENLQTDDLEVVRTVHQDWWHRFYPQSFVSLPDKRLENFYWIQMYKLASATRGDRALMDCTGPWLTVTPWPNAWWNLNVQLSYWPLNASNRLELAGSLEHTLYDHLDQLRQNLPEAYREGAYGLARTTDFHAASETVGIPGVDKNPEVGNLTWACHNLWLIYRHKMDDDLLRNKLFPLLKGAVNYYLYFLKEEADGKLHLPATFSPEYGSAEDCHYDLALLRWGCQTLVKAADRLHIDDPLLPKWKHVLANLTPYPQDENGLRIGRDVPYANSHRHYSHLLAAYPLYLLNREDAADSAQIKQSLDYWQSKAGAHQGYSLTGASSISSALGNGNDALNYLNGLFGRFLSVNTLYRESGPVIETPLSGAQSIHDMLLQSWGDKIRVFPAVPDAWQDVAYYDFRTEGAFTVSASRRAGRRRAGRRGLCRRL